MKNKKTVFVKIQYENIFTDNIETQLITFTCPVSKRVKEHTRGELQDFSAYDEISKKEYEFFAMTVQAVCLGNECQFTVYLTEEEYNEVFFERQLDKQEELEQKQRMFKMLELKLLEIYSDKNLLDKYRQMFYNNDIDGSATGCEFCQHYHKSDYCNIKNQTKPSGKNCKMYEFRRNLDG